MQAGLPNVYEVRLLHLPIAIRHFKPLWLLISLQHLQPETCSI